MKKLIVLIGALTVAGSVRAATVTLGPVTPQTSFNVNLGTNTNFVYDLSNGGGPNCAFQGLYAAPSVTTETFTDGTPATGTLTVNSNAALSLSSATDAITVAAASNWTAVKSTDAITIATTSLLNHYLSFNGTFMKFGVDIATATTSSGTAKNVADYLNANFANIILSTWTTGGVVTTTATIAGTGANSYVLATSTPAGITFASVNYAGGRNNLLSAATITLDGSISHNGVEWTDDGTSSNTAISIAQWLQSNGTFVSTCVAGQSVVTSTVVQSGFAGNSHTLSTNVSSIITIGSANFINGQDNASITIGTVTYSVVKDFAKGAAASNTATNIASTITARGLESCAASGAVVTCTATVSNVNYAWTSSTATALTFSPVTAMGNGGPSGVNIAKNLITVTAHHLGTAQKIWINATAGTIPVPLTNNGTYYAIVVDANNIQLALTSSGAVAGVPVVLTAQTAKGGGSFNLVTPAYAGATTLNWYGSNDGVTATDLSDVTRFGSIWNGLSGWAGNTSVSSMPVDIPQNSIWDFTTIDASRYLILKAVIGTAGAINLRLTGNCR